VRGKKKSNQGVEVPPTARKGKRERLFVLTRGLKDRKRRGEKQGKVRAGNF